MNALRGSRPAWPISALWPHDVILAPWVSPVASR